MLLLWKSSIKQEILVVGVNFDPEGRWKVEVSRDFDKLKHCTLTLRTRLCIGKGISDTGTKG